MDVRFNVVPTHRGELLPAVGVGKAFTTTVADAVAVHPFASVTLTVYVPASAAVTLLIVGFCTADVNPFGPVQL